MTKLSAARKMAAVLADRTRKPAWIWVSLSGPERYFVLSPDKTPDVDADVVDRVIPNLNKETTK